jgi:hypothetical protein
VEISWKMTRKSNLSLLHIDKVATILQLRPICSKFFFHLDGVYQYIPHSKLLRCNSKCVVFICIGRLTEYFRLFPKYIRQNYIKGFTTVLLGERTFCGSINQGYVLCMDAGSSELVSFTCILFIANFQGGFSCFKM